MSVKLSAWVWDGCAAAGVKGIKLLVMVRLADFSSDEGICWPSVETIARQLGAGRSTVITAITQLEKDGWLKRTERRNGQRSATNLYTMNTAKLRKAAEKYQGSDSERSKPEHSDSEHSDSERSENNEKRGSEGSESGHDPSLNTDPSDKKISCPGENPPDEELSTDEFLNRHPDAVIYNQKKNQWATADDRHCAEWIWSKIIALYEQAAEFDGELSRPKEPNWLAWSNEIRLMRTIDKRSHRQICEMFLRVQHDKFWCRNILSPAKLREKWDELVIRLGTVKPDDNSVFRSSFDDVDYSVKPEGFRVVNGTNTAGDFDGKHH